MSVLPLLDLFLELCALPSPSGKERSVADRVGAYLSALGLAWDEDDAGARLDGDTGNIYCRLPSPNGHVEGVPIFLCAHTDTVPPEAAIEPAIEDGIVRNAARTVFGSDNKAAVVVILDATRRIIEERRRHAGIELLFTPQEEGWLPWGRRLRPHAPAGDHRLRLRPGRSDRRDRPRLAPRAAARLPLPRARSPCRG